jgi:hypothetical protein
VRLGGHKIGEGKVSGLKLFHTKGGVAEVVPRLAEVEADVQDLIEAHMETMLGVRFLASEYSTGPVDSPPEGSPSAPGVVSPQRVPDLEVYPSHAGGCPSR